MMKKVSLVVFGFIGLLVLIIVGVVLFDPVMRLRHEPVYCVGVVLELKSNPSKEVQVVTTKSGPHNGSSPAQYTVIVREKNGKVKTLSVSSQQFRQASINHEFKYQCGWEPQK